MRNKKNKSQAPVEYKSSTWKTKIKGDINNPTVKKLVIADFILRWLVRITLTIMTAVQVISQFLP